MIFLMQYAVCLRYLNSPFCYKHFTLSVKTPFGRVEENDPSWYSNGKRSHRKAKKIGYSQYHQRERKATLWCTQVLADGRSVRGTIQLQCKHRVAHPFSPLGERLMAQVCQSASALLKSSVPLHWLHWAAWECCHLDHSEIRLLIISK